MNRVNEIAFRKEKNTYDIIDPLAVIVAMCPELVMEYFEKPCFIEVAGKYTKGMVVIDWVGRSLEKRNPSTIISEVRMQAVLDLLVESVAPKTD